MVKVSLPTTLALTALAALATTAKAGTMNFVNQCSYSINLVHSQSGSTPISIASIEPGSSYSQDASGPAHMFRHGLAPDATLLEFSFQGSTWYDISIIPPMSDYCCSYHDCKIGGKKGFNVPVSVTPKQNEGKATCASLYCATDSETACADAYQYPMDNTKTHHCPGNTEFDVTFCYGGTGGATETTEQTNDGNNGKSEENTAQNEGNTAQNDGNTVQNDGNTVQSDGNTVQSDGNNGNDHESTDDNNVGTVQVYVDEEDTAAATDVGEVRSSHSYRGKDAGNLPGTYQRVVSLAGCAKEEVHVNSPVGPLSEEVSVVFRGPMEIQNIAVYMPTNADASNSTWKRESSYCAESGETENMVFMNNQNADYSGYGTHGPQGYATADGLKKAEEPTTFSGYLAEASTPEDVYGGPGYATGAEVNIMTGAKCDGDCQGYSSENDHHGWGGGKKAFFTKVHMLQGASPNLPAIWMLNAQVLHSNQYGCNCRGMGATGGCGELDIAEVINNGNPALDKISTHYYMFEDEAHSPGYDNFAPRRTDDFTVYCTFIDDSRDGQVSIFELADFDFSQNKLDDKFLEILRNL